MLLHGTASISTFVLVLRERVSEDTSFAGHERRKTALKSHRETGITDLLPVGLFAPPSGAHTRTARGLYSHAHLHTTRLHTSIFGAAGKRACRFAYRTPRPCSCVLSSRRRDPGGTFAWQILRKESHGTHPADQPLEMYESSPRHRVIGSHRGQKRIQHPHDVTFFLR